MHRLLVELAAVSPGDQVLDVGTGTGALALQLGRACPGAEIVGVDPDSRALARARRKVRGTARVRFDHGYAEALPYDDDGWIARRALRHPILQDNLGDAIPRRMHEAGLTDVAEVTHRVTPLLAGTFYRAVAGHPLRRTGPPTDGSEEPRP
jgi:SAM-dependent methyltransferase